MELKLSIMSIASAFVLSALSTWALVAMLNKKKAYVVVKPELLVKSEKKAATPFFGGISFLLAVTICALAFDVVDGPEAGLSLIGLWIFGLAGFADDALKLKSRNGDGFATKQKLSSQILASILMVCLIMWQARASISRWENLLAVPAVVYMVYYVNALNITDGVDGLASVAAIPVLTVICFVSPLDEMRQLGMMAIGAVLGFLLFNRAPAQIFMGDVGSHALGGMIAVMALLAGAETAVFAAGALFFIEFLSSLVQIIGIRLFHRKVFKIAPLHHLLEYHGLSDWKIVAVLSALNFVSSALVLVLRVWR